MAGSAAAAAAAAVVVRAVTSAASFSPELVHASPASTCPQGALGPLSSGKLTSGRTFTAADASANVAVLDSSYAKQNKLKVGSTITIAKTSFKVVGIVSVPAGRQLRRRLHPAGPRPGAGRA